MASEEQTKLATSDQSSPVVNALLHYLKRWYGMGASGGTAMSSKSSEQEKKHPSPEDVQEPEENEPVEEKEPPPEDWA